MYKDFESILVSKEALQKRISELASQLDKDYENSNPLLICILKGSVFFTADLLKAMSIPCEMEFMAVSSYGSDTQTSGEVKMIKDLSVPIEDRDVIIIEDIIDTGNTLSYLKRLLLQRKPKSVKICTLLDKPDRRKVDLSADYVGFVIPDEFAVGYGLDYNEKYRTFDEVYVLKREVYEK